MRRIVLIALVALLATAASPAASDDAPYPGRVGDGSGLIGRAAPSLSPVLWLDGARRDVGDLAGRVLLVRFWTDTCPFCSTTAPVLQDLHERYASEGLEVLGVFHPKPPGDPRIERARAAAQRFGFTFPVALDFDWTALRRWWLEHEPRGWTSVTFLVDRQGVVRLVHPGGEFHPGPAGGHWDDHESCRREHREIVETIETLLAEPAAAPRR